MKILYLNHNPVNQGTYYRCFFLGKRVAELGHKVTLVCSSNKNLDLRVRRKVVNNNFDIVTLPRIRFHKYYTGQISRAVIGSLITLFKKYDLLHSFAVAQPSTALPTIFSKIFRRKPIIIDWDDLWGAGGFSGYHVNIVKKGLDFLETKMPRVGDDLVVTTEFLLSRARKLSLKKPIYKVPNGCNIKGFSKVSKKKARKKLKINPKEKIIVSLGHAYFKSLDILFSSFSKAVKSLPELKLHMVGGISLNSEFKRKYHSIINKNVVLAGELPYKKAMIYLQAADVLALPMENSLIEKARWPVRLGDYLLSNRPIVSNAVGEVKYILEKYDCGLFSKPNDINGFSKNMIKLFNDKKLSSKLASNGLKVARELSWANLAKKLDLLYIKEFNSFHK